MANRFAHLVGSMPFDNEEAAMNNALDALGGHYIHYPMVRLVRSLHIILQVAALHGRRLLWTAWRLIHKTGK